MESSVETVIKWGTKSQQTQVKYSTLVMDFQPTSIPVELNTEKRLKTYHNIHNNYAWMRPKVQGPIYNTEDGWPVLISSLLKDVC